jgi:hypothetical protein
MGLLFVERGSIGYSPITPRKRIDRRRNIPWRHGLRKPDRQKWGGIIMKKNSYGIACCLVCALLMLSCSSKQQNGSAAGSAKGVALGDLTVERCFFYSEGENFKDKSGGALDYKDGAYGKKCLGMRWGEKLSDFVAYDMSLEGAIDSAILVVRVAIDGSNAQSYEIVLDDKTVQTAAFSPTGGYGYTDKEWRCYTVSLGKIEKGAHTLKIRPYKQGGIVNIDCLALGKAG